MVVSLLSTCPAANGVRRVPTHMPLQILLIYQVLIISTPSDFQPVATCGVRKSNQPVFIGHMPQVRIGCYCELNYTRFDSFSWFAFPVKHKWEIWVPALDQVSLHARCGPATLPLCKPEDGLRCLLISPWPGFLRVGTASQEKGFSALWMGWSPLYARRTVQNHCNTTYVL